jgi:hypothetical protein
LAAGPVAGSTTRAATRTTGAATGARSSGSTTGARGVTARTTAGASVGTRLRTSRARGRRNDLAAGRQRTPGRWRYWLAAGRQRLGCRRCGCIGGSVRRCGLLRRTATCVGPCTGNDTRWRLGGGLRCWRRRWLRCWCSDRQAALRCGDHCIGGAHRRRCRSRSRPRCGSRSRLRRRCDSNRSCGRRCRFDSNRCCRCGCGFRDRRCRSWFLCNRGCSDRRIRS